MTRIGSAVGVARSVLAAARDEQITFLSAAVAYYAFVSIVPLLLLGVAIGTAVGGPELADAVVGYLDQFLTASGRDAIRDALTNARGRTGATVVSIALLTWSGLKLFRGLDVAFSQIYGVRSAESLPRQLADALVVLLAVPLALAASLVVGIVVPVLGPGPLANAASIGTLLVTLTLVFLPMYYVFPDLPMTVSAALPGAMFAAVGWTVLSQAFRVYAATVGSFEVYGLLGAALLLVTWLYFSGIVITLGAILNAVLAGRDDEDADETRPAPPTEAPDVAELGAEVRALREELDAKTVSKNELEGELKQYVRRRIRSGKARGWGPYLVLLYGTAMTIGAFAYLGGGWAILGMVVVWLSTLGLYTLMVLFGLGMNAVGLPGRVADRVRSWRS
ncbi:YihY/virulence factor BrkB family protein [Halobacterium zhouii]|uniref:YihY/virulence factor BrkB family protein n=1 Tax=Halobacterium zhouii TaxID=2902624 RepID=UPI001E31A494|nr:YihY/virulence factor BrkB family protein [Halobacterium zhouii]